MPTFNNYTFSNVTYTITEGDSIPTETGGTAVITISPVSGYTLDVNDFSLASGFSNSYVDSVAFAQDGDNVTATVTFTAGTTMPSSNLEIPLCIVGSGDVELITIAGTYSSTIGSNITPTSQTNIAYSGSGTLGESELLFTKTYTADSGYYFETTPTAQITTGNQSNYSIAQTPTYNSDNQLTALQFDINYVYPNNSVSGDVIKFVADAKEIYVPTEEITRWNIRNSVISTKGEIRTLYVWGEAGATYSITLTDGTTTENIATNVTMGSDGVDEYLIEFDPNSSNNTITWTFTISGDIDSDLSTTIVLTQAQEIDGTFLPKTSSIFDGGYSVVNNGDYLARPVPGSSIATVSIEWLITSADGEVITINDTPVSQIQWDNQGGIDQTITSASAGTATLTSTTDLEAGMRFNGDGNGFPLDYEIVSVDSSTQITYTPTDLSITEDTVVTFTNNNGFNFDQSNLVTQFANNERTAVTISGDIRINTFGDEDTSFYLDLEEVLDTIALVGCSDTASSGSDGITEYSIQLSPSGGLLTFLVDPQGVPDKFEIVHGDGDGTKVSTSSMTAANTSGPFDNAFGTPPSNIVPTMMQAAATDQFIGTDSGTVPTKQTEFNVDTGYNISSMTVGSTTYKQVIWWEYDADDYAANSIATLRVTGPSGTAWSLIRECCPSTNCTETAFTPSAFTMTASNTSSSNACSDTTYSNTVYVSDDTFAFGGTVYTDSALTTAFVGDSGYYGVNNNPKFAVKINSDGEIIEPLTLCNP